MKRLLSIAISMVLMGGICAMSGCKETTAPIKPQSDFDYDALYHTEITAAYPTVEPGYSNKASYGYTLKSEQGYNDWYYLYEEDGAYAQMTYSADSWQGGGAALCGPAMKPGAGTAVRQYHARKGGEVTIYGNYKCADADAAAAAIKVYHNDALIYSGTLEAGDTVGYYFEIKVTLNDGDNLYFAVEGKNAHVLLDPVVDFGGHGDQSFYHLTAHGKQYGDVFPWYDTENHKLYMGFLWSDNARGGDYYNALEVSDNMLTFRDIPEANNYDLWQTYKENGRLHFVYNPNNYVDHSIYSFGVRDNMIYRDPENNRWLMIAGCYYTFNSYSQTSDLVIYESKDELGFSWNPVGNVVEAGYNRNLPECPTLMKIGDRWYVFVSVAYVTAHQVGPLQYWTGDAGVDCMDVDWQSKDFSFLDGEDLCAARPIQVGDKVYMWGWIPNTYDTMPWAPWAGYLNLPREVIQLSDGSLGGRLDPGLSKLLNYGRIFTLGAGNYAMEKGNAEDVEGGIRTEGETTVLLGADYNRNYITYSVDMKNCTTAGYIMRQDGKEYQVLIVKEEGKTYLKVLSPNDDKHKINSVIEIQDLHSGKFDVKIVCDGEFIEFFVNDEYALTAHTAMTGSSYSAGLYAVGEAVFTNVTIHKLISYSDIA